MGRRITPRSFSALLRDARKTIPCVAITTDIITGFPGETEQEFIESMSFVKEMDFARGHVFTYSARPGTPAASLPGQVPYHVAKERNARMREIFKAGSLNFMIGYIGHDLQVLWEKATPLGSDQWELKGLTDNYMRVMAYSQEPCHNQVMNVHITGMNQDGLVGEIANN